MRYVGALSPLGQGLPEWLPLWIVTASLITFVMYGLDKRMAGLRGWRTAESTLHLVALLGGWPGAIAAQYLFRHKLRKPGFMRVFWITAALNIALTLAACAAVQATR